MIVIRVVDKALLLTLTWLLQRIKMEVTRKIKDPGTKARVLDRQAERRRSTYEDTGSLARDGVRSRLRVPVKAGILNTGDWVLGEGPYVNRKETMDQR